QEPHSPTRSPRRIDVRRWRSHGDACDVDVRPRSILDKSLQELRGGDRAALTPAAVFHVGELGIDLFVVSLREGHAPDPFSRRLARGDKPLSELVVVGKEAGVFLTERDYDRAGEGCEVDNRPRRVS